MKTAIRSMWLAGLLALPLAACNQAASPPPAAGYASVTPSGFRMPEGAGCRGEIDRYRAVLGNDLASGNVNRSVYERADREASQAAAACAAGRDAEALRTVQASKARTGYR